MKRSDFLAVAVITLGMVLLLYGLLAVPQAFFRIRWLLRMRTSDGAQVSSVLTWVTEILMPIAYLGGAVLLILFGESIAKVLIRDDRVVACSMPGRWERPVFSLAARVVGIFWLVSYLPRMINDILGNIWNNVRYPEFMPEWVPLVGSLTVVAVGIYLLTGAKHLVRALYGGGDPENESTDRGEA